MIRKTIASIIFAAAATSIGAGIANADQFGADTENVNSYCKFLGSYSSEGARAMVRRYNPELTIADVQRIEREALTVCKPYGH